ncbi:MAG TPA: hypothetical protein VNS62_12655, partial [Candidatus Udaeobacter sp.]|nr:hypothetical protein [Candidatus Udaeobacter sp.]
SPLLILRALRGAKAPLFHGTTGIQEFFFSLLESCRNVTITSFRMNWQVSPTSTVFTTKLFPV